MRLMTAAYKIFDRAILNFVPTLNFISIQSPSIYKLSMNRFVYKVHLNVDV